MGKLVALFRIMPEDTGADLESLRKEVRSRIPPGVSLERMEVVPIAFGLKALDVTVLMEDEGGSGPDGIEQSLSSIPNVGSVQLRDVGRI